MANGFGPYGVIGTGEIIGSLVMLAVAASAFVWMAWRTRGHGHT